MEILFLKVMRSRERMIKKIFKSEKLAESLIIAMLLALVGGYLDIYSYLARGKVFANTQTGNLVLLGYNIAERNGEKVIYYLISIIAFIGGIGLAKTIEHRFKEGKYFYWLHIALMIEMGGLVIVMFVPEGRWNVLANMIVSFVCAVQVQSFPKVNGNAYSTIMFTGNLKNVAERFSHYWITKESKALENGCVYLAIIVMFVMGGWLGALITKRYMIKAVGWVNVVLSFIFILLYIEKRNTFLNN